MKYIYSKNFIPFPEATTPGHSQAYFTLIKNVFIRHIYFKNSGDIHPGHKHNHDHATLVASGGIDVEVNGIISRYMAPNIVYVLAEFEHKFTAVENNTCCYCIHAIRNGKDQDDIYDPASIPEGLNYLTDLPDAMSLTYPNITMKERFNL